MTGYHWPLAFSSAARWVECPGSVQLSQDVPPQPDDEHTLTGNAADWVAKQYAAGVEVPYGADIPTVPRYKVDYEMIAGAKLWAKSISYGAVSGMPVVSTSIHPTAAGGEPDGWVWNAIERLLELPDYKFGFGVVEVFENWQLAGYAISILESLDLLSDPDVKVRLRIVQPRAYHKDGPVRDWLTTVGELRAYWNIMRTAAREALPPKGSDEELALVLHRRPAPRTKTGPHCLHCPARLVNCKTLQGAVMSATEFIGCATQTNMDPTSLGIMLSIVDSLATLVEAYQTGLHAQADGLMRKGKQIPGWKMERGKSNLSWNQGVTVSDIDTLGMLLNKDMRKPPTVHAASITPTQALAAGVDEAVMAGMSWRPPGAMKLVRDDGSEIRRIFGGNAG